VRLKNWRKLAGRRLLEATLRRDASLKGAVATVAPFSYGYVTSTAEVSGFSATRITEIGSLIDRPRAP
jgi:hypothetical protein